MANSFSKFIGSCAIIALTLTGCATDLNSTTYTSSGTSGKVLEGVVISARPVTIKENDKMQDNTLGMIGGGLLGGVAGSAFGKGTGQGLATVGGALAGAAGGAALQGKLGTQQGTEYVVRIDKKYLTGNSLNKNAYSVGGNSVSDQINNSIDVAGSQTDLLSVTQGNDVMLQVNQRVLIIYNNDRPRLAPAY